MGVWQGLVDGWTRRRGEGGPPAVRRSRPVLQRGLALAAAAMLVLPIMPAPQVLAATSGQQAASGQQVDSPVSAGSTLPQPSVTLTGGIHKVDVSWTVPDPLSTADVTAWDVEWTYASDYPDFKHSVTADAASSSTTITDLPRLATIYVRVRAGGDTDTGPWSTEQVATTSTYPAAPVIVSVTPDEYWMVIRWEPGDSDPVWTYVVQVSTDGGVTWGYQGATSETEYRAYAGYSRTRSYRVYTSSVAGYDSEPSAAMTATTRPVPEITSMTGGSGSVTLEWALPDGYTTDGMIGWEIRWSANYGPLTTVRYDATATGATISVPHDRWIVATLRAVYSDTDLGPQSYPMEVLVEPAPVPVITSMTGGDQSVSLEWALPDGATAEGITGWEVCWTANWTSMTTTAYGLATTSTTITGLPDNTLIYASVQAVYGDVDKSGGSDWASTTTNQAPGGEPPSAGTDYYNLTQDTTITAGEGDGLLANDSDPEGAPLTLVAASTDWGVGGTLDWNADGSFSYTPPAGWSGWDHVTYTVSDGHRTTVGYAYLIVSGILSCPESLDMGSVAAGGSITVWPTEVEDDGCVNAADSMSATLVTPGSQPVTDNGDSSFTLSPAADFTGDDTFTVDITDGTTTVSVSIVLHVFRNHPPVAPDVTYHVPVGGALTVLYEDGVARHVSDRDGDWINVVLDGEPAHGTIADFASWYGGTFTYTPEAGFAGTDRVGYSAIDSWGAVTHGVILLDVHADRAPNGGTVHVALFTEPSWGDGARFGRNSWGIRLAGIDLTDPDGDRVIITAATQPSHGLLRNSWSTPEFPVDGLSYHADQGFVGTDTFTLTLSDGILTSELEVVVDVLSWTADDLGCAGGVSSYNCAVWLEATEDTPITYPKALGTLLGTLPSGTTAEDWTFQQYLQRGGTATTSADGTIDFTPEHNFTGGALVQAFAVYRGVPIVDTNFEAPITVHAVNDAPVCTADKTSFVTSPGVGVNGTITCTDAEGDFLALSSTAPEGSGFLISEGGTWTFSSMDTGIATFSVTASDGTDDSLPVEIQVEVALAGPAAPVNVTASPRAGAIRIAWSPGTGGTEAVRYVLLVTPDFVDRDFVSTDGSPYDIVVPDGTTMMAVVYAIDADGHWSDPSEIVSGTSYPGLEGPTATPGAGSVEMAWSLPDGFDSNAGVTGYEIEWSTSDSGSHTVTTSGADATSATISGLGGGVTVTVKVRALYGENPGPWTDTTSATTDSTLTVTRAGTGSGTVTSSPAGIDCGSTCSFPYTSGTSVTLTATPATGSTFTGWSGACSGTGTCTLSMTADRAATATFALQTRTLAVTRAGTGSGTVTSSPAGINCGTQCAVTVSYGTSVTLTATPATGSTFTGWSGACTGKSSSCTVSLTADTAVTATFTSSVVRYTLTVTKAGTGSGTVTSSPAGISCGSTCSFPFTSGTSVTLTATPATGSTFTGWSGACTGTGTCTLSMKANRAVTATFAVAPVKTATSLTYTGPTTAREGASIKLTAKLTAGTKVVAGASVTFTFNGRTYTATTTTCGYATVTVTAPRTDGVYAITMTYAGSATYAASSASARLTVS